MSEGFLSRWSRLKRNGGPAPAPSADPGGADEHARSGPAAAPEGAPRGIWSTPSLPAGPLDASGPVAGATPSDQSPPAEAGEPAPQALPPIESLDFDADFKPFMQADVAPATRNAALRKLFADPSFNVMDGLDVYIDDYSLPDPIPDEMLRGLVQSQTLGLFREEARQILQGDGAEASQVPPSPPALAPQGPSADLPSEVVPDSPAQGLMLQEAPGPRVAAAPASPGPAAPPAE